MTTPRFILCSLLVLVCVSAHASSDWEATSLPQRYSYRLAVNANGEVFAIGDSMLYSSTDDGFTWTQRGRYILNGFVQSLQIAPSGTIFAGDFALGVHRSTNNGGSWSDNLVDEGCNGLAVHPQGYIFAGLTYSGNGKVHRSSDGGDTWTGVALPNSSGGFATGCFAFGDNNEVYAGSIDGFYKSTDFGLSWTQNNTGLLGKHVRVMTVAPNQDIYIQTIYSSSFDGMYRSTNRGESWQRLEANDPYFSALIAAGNGDLYGTSDDGASRSTNGGVTWTEFNTGLATFERLSSIVISPTGRMFTGGYRVYRSTALLTDVDEPVSHPVSFALEQNYPNPFNPKTEIVYEVDSRQSIELSVYDVLGRKVVTLVEGMQDAGEHTVSFDGSSLASGVYLYRLTAGGLVQTRRMVLTK